MKKLIDFETLQSNCKQRFYRYSSGSLNSGEKVCKLQNNGLYHEKCNKEHCPIWNSLPDAELTARELLVKVLKSRESKILFLAEFLNVVQNIDMLIKKVEGI